MTRNELNEFVQQQSDRIQNSAFQSMEASALGGWLLILFGASVVVGFAAGVAWGVGMFFVMVSAYGAVDAATHMAFAKHLDAQSRALQAVAALRATDDPL